MDIFGMQPHKTERTVAQYVRTFQPQGIVRSFIPVYVTIAMGCTHVHPYCRTTTLNQASAEVNDAVNSG